MPRGGFAPAEPPPVELAIAEAPPVEPPPVAAPPAEVVPDSSPWEPLAPTPLIVPSAAAPDPAPAEVAAPLRRRRPIALYVAGGAVVAAVVLAIWRPGAAPKPDDSKPSVATPPVARAKSSSASPKLRGYPPLPLPAPGVEGYERAKAFLLAKSEWEQSLGPTREEVLASPELAPWNARAAELAAFVRDADALTLRLDESGTLATERHRATAHGALVPDRLELLRIEVSDGRTPSLVPLADGRFAAEFELGFDVASVRVKFTRLDGTLLAALEIRVPGAAPTVVPVPVPIPAAAPSAAPSATKAITDAIATFGFRRTDEHAGDHPIWIHEKTGLRFVELRIPESIERALPRFAPKEGEPAEGADAAWPVLVGECECTNAAWRVWRSDDVPADEADDLPVANVGGPEIVAFCAAMGYELPYAAEWRWFALAGASADPAATPDSFAAAAWFKKNADGDRHPARRLAANAFGLFDAQGNLWELCLGDSELWSDVAARTDAKSTVRPYLGGSCNSSAERCKVERQELAHDGPGATRGFRPLFRLPRSR